VLLRRSNREKKKEKKRRKEKEKRNGVRVKRRYVAGGGERGREGTEHGHVLLQDLPEELCALLVKALEFLECVALRCVVLEGANQSSIRREQVE
jgi:hypothetical protein